MEQTKGAMKSKTMGFAAAMMALGLLEQFTPLVPALVPAEYQGMAIAGVGFVVAALRWVTTKPLAEK